MNHFLQTSLLILELVVLEGLLSFDNALALAAIVKKKLYFSAKLQKRALFWGLFGAYTFRTGMVLIGVWLIRYEWVKVIAGGYLVYLAVHELFFTHTKTLKHDATNESLEHVQDSLKIFIRTVVQVEVMDAFFSIDSLAVALAISNKTFVLLAGAVLGILCMRVASGFFITLLDKFPILEKTAFLLVGIAGVNVLLKTQNLPVGFGYMISIDKGLGEIPFFIVMAVILVGSFLVPRSHRYPTGGGDPRDTKLR